MNIIVEEPARILPEPAPAPEDAAEARHRYKASLPRARLQERHLEECRLVPNRLALLDRMPKGGVIAEIGVASGDFSAEILARCRPNRLHLIDMWQTERYRECLEEVRRRFAAEIEKGVVETRVGTSIEKLSEFPDGHFDWVYIDTDHSYETTAQELALSAAKVKPGGMIAGHDFCVGNVTTPVPYGVIEAAHEFCVRENWGYRFLSLEFSGHFSFCLARIA